MTRTGPDGSVPLADGADHGIRTGAHGGGRFRSGGARRHPWRSALAVLGAEAKVTMRDRAGLLVPLALPLVIMLANTANPVVLQEVMGWPYRPFEGYLVPMLVTMVSAVVAVVNLPSFLATYRRTGILRTLSVTPVSPRAVLGAQYLVSLVQLVVGVGVTLAVAALAFGLRAPGDPGGALLASALGILAMFGVGSVVAAVSPTPSASVAIGLVAFLGLGALGGMFGPTEGVPAPLRAIGDHLPFGAMTDTLGAAWRGDPMDAPQLASLAVVAALGAIVAWALVGRRPR